MAAQDFFNKVYRDARDVGANHNQASIAAAQSAIETGWGKSVKGNAYFGIKAGRSWKGKTVSFTTHEVINGKRKKIVDKFRAYDDFKDSVRDHMVTIEAKWPKSYNATSLKAAALGLDKGVHGRYATDPTYSDKVYNTAKRRAAPARRAYGGVSTSKPTKTVPVKETRANPTSRILPMFRPKQSDPVTRAVLDKFARFTPAGRRDDKVKILVVRGYYLNSMGRKDKNDRAIYDDAIFVVSPHGVHPFNGNSDPSVFRHRVATIKDNQAIQYKPGLHGYKRKGGPYKAFRQNAPCTVVRDGVGDDTGMFAVNFHRGGVNGTSSLGCLTVPPHQWDEFYGLVSRLLRDNNQDTFYVTLVSYGGGNPPVTVSSPEPTNQSTPVIVGTIAATGGALAATWWDNITAWFGGIFPW